jgi:RNA polymerase sigma-70 factor (family 1)
MSPVSNYSDEQLLQLLKQDHEPAFAVIYQRYWEGLYDAAERILGDRAAAQDCVQEVFIYLWNRRHTIELTSLKSYIYQATRFQVFKFIRAKKTSADFSKRLATVSGEILTEDPVVFKELKELLYNVISSLPEDQQEIFKMNRELGMTYKEIAEQKNISVKTVEKKMSQALKNIRLNTDDALALIVISYLLK